MDPAVAYREDDEVGRRAVDAAVELLAAGGVDRFALPYIANRVGVDIADIERAWTDRTRLLTAAWTSALGWQGWIPDTGTLAGDLTAFGAALQQSVQTPEGRMLLRSSLPIDETADLAKVRRQFWTVQFDAAAAIIARAVDRGELPDACEPLGLMQMFCSAAFFDTLYLDSATPPGYLESLVGVFLYGVARQPPDDLAELRRQVWAAMDANPTDDLGKERPAPNYAHATSAQIRQAILDATISETTARGAGLVTRSGIARRVGVQVHVVERMWTSDADLLLDAGARARRRTRPLPDTGNLRDDVLAFTGAKATLVATADARTHFLSALVRQPGARNAAILIAFWAAGLRESTQMALRAQERGELRDGVNPDHATRVLVASLYYDLFFDDAPMRPGYALLVLTVFLGGAAAFSSA